MKIAVASTWHGSGQKYFNDFQESARAFGIDIHNFDPEKWPGEDWRTIEWWRKSAGQARFVKENADKYDCFLFVDSHDIVWATGLDEIVKKFLRISSPIVFAGECYCWPDKAQAPLYPHTTHRCKYLNAGMWMATAEAAVPFTQELAEIAARKEKCDQGIVVDMLLQRKHPIKLDTACSLCFCLNIDSPSYLDFSGERIRTNDTGETPCLFHGNGGSDMVPVIKHILRRG